MRSYGKQAMGVSSAGAWWRACRLLIAFLLAAVPLALLPAQSGTPGVSPDRIEDIPQLKADVDSFPTVDNFAWRAFIALNWPSLTDPAYRGLPDRTKTLGDPGPRVWETFKARYELFQVGPDGTPIASQPWATYDAANPCGADTNDRAKTLATFDPFMDFNQFASGVAANPLVAQERTLHRLRNPHQRTGVCCTGAQRLEPGPEPARSGASGEIARRLDCGQGSLAHSYCGRHAGRARPLLRGQECQRR